MRYLGTLFEQHFIKKEEYIDHKTNEKKTRKIHDGKKFEEMVSDLLEKMYPDTGSWNPTAATHDGSRDYYTQIQDRLLWAECKNYNNNIALSTIAPTLVMAQVCNVDELLFFSSSPINENTKKKLCFYSHINKKVVKFYDGEVFEQLLFQYRAVLDKYLGSPDIEAPTDSAGYTVYQWLFKNPFLNNYKADYVFDKEPLKLQYNDVFSICYAIINCDVQNPLEVVFTLDPAGEDYDCFALLNREDEESSDRNICIRKRLTPNEMYFHSFNFRIIKNKSSMALPVIRVSINRAEHIEEIPAIEKNIECTCLGKAQLVGSHYENILARLESEILDVNYLSGILIYGSSGTGKTRLLEDSLKLLIKHDYKVLNFVGIVEDSGINVIKEIVYVLFELSDELINYDLLEQVVPKELVQSTEVKTVIMFLKYLSEPNANIKDIIKKYGKIIYEKLSREKYVLIIDNLQYFDDSMILFLEELLRYSKNNNRDNWLSLILVINTDYTDDASSCIKIKYMVEQLSAGSGCKFVSEPIDGFATPEISLNFLKQILRMKSEDYDNHLLKLVNRLSSKPYYIEQAIIDLINREIITFVNDVLYIKEPDKFINSLDSIPDGINETMKKRWAFLLERYPQYRMDFLTALSMIHLCRKIDKVFWDRIQFHFAALNILCDYHIIKREYTRRTCYYLFDHDLVENYFCQTLSLNDFGIAYLHNGYMEEIKNYNPAIYNICLLKYEKMTFDELNLFISSSSKITISYKIFYTYYELLANKYLNVEVSGSNDKLWLFNLNQICIRIRDRLGNRQAEELFLHVYGHIAFQDEKVQNAFEEYTTLLFTLCETLEHLGMDNRVIEIYNEHLSYFRKTSFNDRTEIKEVIAFIHNRLHVAYKRTNRDDAGRMQWAHLKTSLKLSKNLSDKRYLAENLFDQGNLYYDFSCHQKKLLECWETGCELVKDNHIELMTLHRIKKLIQISFIKGDLKKIPSLIRSGFRYIEHGKYNEFPLFFSSFFYLANSLHLIMSGSDDFRKISEELNNAESEYLIFGRNRAEIINFLRGKLAGRQKDIKQAYQFYRVAYQNYDNKSLTLAADIANYDILAEDMVLTMRGLHADLKTYPLAFLSDNHRKRWEPVMELDDRAFETYRKKHRTNALYHSADCKEGYPSI